MCKTMGNVQNDGNDVRGPRGLLSVLLYRFLDAGKTRAGAALRHLFSTPSQEIIPGIGVGGRSGGKNLGKLTQNERKISCILKSIKLFENNSQELA